MKGARIEKPKLQQVFTKPCSQPNYSQEPKVKATQMSTDGWMDEQKVVHIQWNIIPP